MKPDSNGDTQENHKVFVESFCRNEFRAFLSVDIDNSSALKEAHTESWYRAFYLFLNDFREFFLKKYLYETEEKPEVWKYLGDEIIFQVKISHYKQIRDHVKNFLDSIQVFNKKSTPISCKGTIWLAEFPVYNMRINTHKYIGSVDIDNTTYDYIGKSMDAGFRLSKFATREKLVLSVDAMFMLAHVMNDAAKEDRAKWCIKTASAEILRGVYEKKPYPVFWIDINKSFCEKENTVSYEKIERVISGERHFKFVDIKDFCYQYIKKHDSMCVPFMDGNPDGTKQPENYASEREKIEEVIHHILSEQGEDAQLTSDAGQEKNIDQGTLNEMDSKNKKKRKPPKKNGNRTKSKPKK